MKLFCIADARVLREQVEARREELCSGSGTPVICVQQGALRVRRPLRQATGMCITTIPRNDIYAEKNERT